MIYHHIVIGSLYCFLIVYFLQSLSKRLDNIKQLKFYSDIYKLRSKESRGNFSKWLYSLHLKYRDELVKEYINFIPLTSMLIFICILFFGTFKKLNTYEDVIWFYVTILLTIVAYYKEFKTCHEYNDLFMFNFISKNK